MIVRDPGTAAHPACCAAIALLLFVSGCQMGPGAMKLGHQQYSAVLRQILNEQMLLNLVRLRYTDAPMFLQITSISTQFVFDRSGSVSPEGCEPGFRRCAMTNQVIKKKNLMLELLKSDLDYCPELNCAPTSPCP